MIVEVKHAPATCSVCVNPSTVVSVNVDEHTPLIRSSSRSSSASGIGLRTGSHYLRYPYEIEESNKFNWFLVIALVIFFLTGICIAIHLLLNEDTKYIPEIYKVITRSEWNATTSIGPLFKVLQPFDHVLITDTGTATCDNFQSCCQILRDMEQYANMNFHFFIDTNGNIFEGLGWHQRTQQVEIDQNSFQIGLLGNYDNTSPSREQIAAVRILVEIAVSKNVLKTCYTVQIPQTDIQKLSLIDLESIMQLDSYRECMR